MASYNITSPDGQKYTVNAPDDASQEDVLAYAQKSFKMAKAPAKKEQEKPSLLSTIGQGIGNMNAGALRGLGSIGATLLAPLDMAKDAIDGKGLSLESNRQRRADMDSALREMGADTDSMLYGGGKLAGEIAGTAGAGGLVAGGLKAIPFVAKYAAPVIDAIGSSGMTSGGLAGAKGLAARAVGGGVAGGAQAAMIDPRDAASGAVIGAVSPAVLQLAGKFGTTVYNAVKGNRPGAGAMLAKAMNVSEDELPAIIQALKSAPESIVNGSKLTVNQALQQQGSATPGSKLLERIVSGGPGGDVLLKRYADQATARMGALESQGAQIYQGAAKEEATNAGNKIGAMLRTQAGDDKAAARAAWESVYGRAVDDGVNLHLPLDAMNDAMSPLGRGSVIPGRDARNVLSVANDIGTMEIPAVAPLARETASNSQTLEKAVRAFGGIRGGAGEIRDLGIKQSGTTGLVNNKTGQSADMVAEEMHRRGFIPDADPATLFDALRNGGGRKLFANDQVESNGMQRLAESAMGDAPGAERIPVPVPFAEFQRLRRDSGSLAAKAGERAGGETEAGVLGKFQDLLTKRADDAANGSPMVGDVITPEFLAQYNAARTLTKRNADLYKGGNNITQILRKPVGQDFTLTGDEITNKLWHGGAGLSGDVSNLRNVLSDNNQTAGMDALRRFIMTDAASKTTAAGNVGSALPRYVESRMPGLLEALQPEQLNALKGVASDIRNQDAANSVQGLLGSDTHAKISRALDGGLLDSPIAKTLANFKGANILREKATDMVKSYKGKTIAELMANPKEAAKALADSSFSSQASPEILKALAISVARSAPAIGQSSLIETR